MVERHADAVLAAQLRQLVDVLRGHRRADVLDVAGRQRARVAVGQHYALVLAAQAHQRVAHLVVPVAHDRGHRVLQFGDVADGLVADLRPHHDGQSRQRRLAHLHRGIALHRVQRHPQGGLDAFAHRGVEAIPRHEHHAGEEPAVTVAAHEQSRARALAQFENAHGRAEQFILGALQQLFARQRFQDVAQRLAGIGVALEARTGQHRLDLVPHQRHVLRPRHVGAGGEQAQEALLGDGTAVRPELQHADVIHVTGAMHVRTRIGLGQDDRVGGAGLRQLAGGQGAQRTRGQRAVGLAQDAQARGFARTQHAVAVGIDHLVFAVAEEGEVVVRQPAHERCRLLRRGFVQRGLALRQLCGDRQRLLAHRAPVGDRGAHVFQRRLDLRLQLFLLGGIGGAVDLEMHHRLGVTLLAAQFLQRAGGVARDSQHRMDHRMDLQVGRHHHAHRVDQERHVVGDHLQQAAPGVKIRGAQHAHRGAAGRALLHELQQAADQRRPLHRRVQLDVAAGDPCEEGGAEHLGLGQALGRHAALFQLGEHYGREGGVICRKGRIHGICW